MGVLGTLVTALAALAALAHPADALFNTSLYAHPDGIIEQSVLESSGSVECGGRWQRCCPGSRCNAADDACDEAGQCAACGGWPWSPCCGGACPRKIQGARVVCYSNQCQPCGAAWERPCDNGCAPGNKRNQLTSRCEPVAGQRATCACPASAPGAKPPAATPSPAASPGAKPPAATPTPGASPGAKPPAATPPVAPAPGAKPPAATPSPAASPGAKPTVAPAPSQGAKPPGKGGSSPVFANNPPPGCAPATGTVAATSGGCGSPAPAAPSGKVVLNDDGSTTFRKSAAGSPRWKYPMNEAFGMSLFFYEAQRSGPLPADNRVLWRGDSPAGAIKNDGDLSGGWYDAGDHVKFNYPLFSAAARLAGATWKFEKTLAESEFDGSTNLRWAQREVRWIMDYIVRCNTAPKTLVVQVGDGGADHGYLGRAEFLDMQRPVHTVSVERPGPDAVAAAAAALANGYLALKGSDAAFAGKCLERARELYAWAVDTAEKQTYDASVPAATAFYKSTGVNHQLLYAAASLLQATGDAKYSADAQRWGVAPEDRGYGPYKSYGDWIGWDMAWFDGAVLMLDRGVDPGTALGFKAQLSRTVSNWVRGSGGVEISPKGQRFVSQWGSNRYALNAAAIALLAAPHFEPAFATTARCFAVSQLHYVWGDAGRSFVVGFGEGAPLRPHHRNSACTLEEKDRCAVLFSDPRANPNVLHGALVGGPTRPDDSFPDSRTEYISSEVAVDYNAMYTVATAAAMALGPDFWDRYPAICEGSVRGVTF